MRALVEAIHRLCDLIERVLEVAEAEREENETA